MRLNRGVLCLADGAQITRDCVINAGRGCAYAEAHVLVTPGNARGSRAGDSEGGGACGFNDDTALHAPQPVGYRGRDSLLDNRLMGIARGAGVEAGTAFARTSGAATG